MKSRTTVYFILFVLFLSGGIAAIYILSRPSSPQTVVNTVSNNLAEELESVAKIAVVLQDQITQQAELSLTQESPYPFIMYENSRVAYWSDNNFIPSVTSVSDTFQLKLLRSGSSDYLARKWKLSSNKFMIAIIPLYRRFNITNDYLNIEWNPAIFPSGNISILEPNATIGLPVCINNDCPFKISFIQNDLPIQQEAKLVAVVLISLAVIVFFLFIYEYFRKVTSPDVVFVILCALLWIVRLLMTKFNFPGAILQNDLFNPQIFAASNLNASLGDLIINEVAVFVLCFYLFKNLFHFRLIKVLQQNAMLTWLLSIVAGIGVLFAMLFPFVVIQTLHNNSSIILDISESLMFNGLRVTAIIAILLSGVCSFLFSHAFIRLLIGNENRYRIFISFIVALIIFSIVNELTRQSYLSSVIAGVFYFLLVYTLKLYASLKRLSFVTFTYLFVSIFFLSANGAYAIQHFSHQEKIENQFKFARNFLIDRDYFGEYLLRELSIKIGKDAFIQSRVITPFLSKDAIKQKIRQVFLPSYFNKYDVEIYIFNAAGEALDYRSDISFSSLLAAYDQDGYKTEYEKIYYVSSPEGDVTQKYLVVVPIYRMKTIAGHIVVELSLKRIIPENVYPELLVDNRMLQFYRSEEISYAVFVNDKVLYSSGVLNYEGLFDISWFGNADLHTKGISVDGYDHIADEDENGRIAVVSSPHYSLTHVLSNFSFLFALGLIGILLFIFIQGILNYMHGDKLYFSARIQLFLNLAFFLPLIIVSVVTLSVTNRSSQNQINAEYLSKAKKFSDQIAGELNRYLSNANVNVTSFENKLTDLAKLTNLDANVYDAKGMLLATSQPLIFENNLISNFINADAIQRVNNGENLFIETEKVGTLKYYIAYAALKASTTGQLIGILGIPFFQSIYSLEKVQINIFTNILNIFALIFIVLVALSYFVSQWLTFPLNFITQSLRKTSLTKINQPLVWKADDEIGLMVKEYNQMLFKLSESKAELEQTQRERAWREIAQQIAHEIKNPLTPMKLTLQQLERSLQLGNATTDKTQKAILSLLTQVNTLNDIASSFSSFAKMPEPVIKSLELVSLLKRIIDLHSHSGDLQFEATPKEILIMGDEQLLGRTFSNLILNALQAVRPGEPAKVWIRLICDSDSKKCVVSFHDNGRGIEAAVADSIFVPHFTTKKSGSGLGLAIAKQAIEQMKGRIWFETEVSRGTTFFIELPVV